MLSAFFDSPVRVRTLRAGPSGASLDGFADALSDAGYAEITARRHLRAAEHFAWWAARHDLWPSAVTDQAVDRFEHHVPRCRCGQFGHADRGLLHGVRLFVRHLEATGTIKVAAVRSVGSDPALLGGFSDWMREQRGT
jgi:hypothetical protein